MTEYTSSDFDEFRADLETVRQHGFTANRQEYLLATTPWASYRRSGRRRHRWIQRYRPELLPNGERFRAALPDLLLVAMNDLISRLVARLWKPVRLPQLFVQCSNISNTGDELTVGRTLSQNYIFCPCITIVLLYTIISSSRSAVATSGAITEYTHRWVIERGYKAIKRFMAATTSKDFVYGSFVSRSRVSCTQSGGRPICWFRQN